jgi:two-component system, NarL family, nitrate/nitrite sensor histidine kinase NarX
MALARDMMERSAEQLATINQADQERIAQDMHDTLAQNIAYLRLKLDQLSTDHVLRDIKQIRTDLGKMRGIADEAYQQVRGTLDILHINLMKEFTELLQEQVYRSQETTRIKIEYSKIGQAHPLTPSVKRQAFFICKEALNNAISHSKANTINITVSWAASEMIVDISDDGCGFDSLSSHDGHYGLSIMRERSEDISGNLVIQTAQDTGTRVTLKVPLLSVQDIGWPHKMPTRSYNLS